MMNLKLEDIKNLVDEPYFTRGREYFDEGMVEIVSASKKSVNV